MRYPNPNEPVDADMANEMKREPGRFEETAREWTRLYAAEEAGVELSGHGN